MNDMKKSFIIIGILFAISCQSEIKKSKTEVVIQEPPELDSVVCYADLVNTFPFETDSAIFSNLRHDSAIKQKIKTYLNKHVDSEIDSVFTFYKDSSFIQFYKTSSEIWVYNMTLKSPILTTRFGLKVGDKMTDEKLKEVGCQAIDNNVRKFVFMEVEGLTWISFILNNKIIKEISYHGYAD